jgi:hypothetical protein
LEKHRFYDAMVIGSGDRAMACAAFGRMASTTQALRLNEPQTRHYQSWAASFHQEVRADVGYLEGRIFHLWHGERLHRRYGPRHSEFAQLPFDPIVDLRVNETGAFEWADRREDLNCFATQYFRSRLEDGA